MRISSGVSGVLTVLVVGTAWGCQQPATGDRAAADRRVKAGYSRETGYLEQLTVERDTGSIEARAYMQGAQFKRIELDTNGDGQTDRWEYYAAGESPAGAAPSGGPPNPILRAEQATRFNGTVSRWEYYEAGVIARVEEDVSDDGRIDKWERYAGGELAAVELDLSERGRPDRRLVFRADGSTEVIDLP
ncbi:MAG: hypothetical protein ABL971_00135 [Vicinamibacterales bacterium]